MSSWSDGSWDIAPSGLWIPLPSSPSDGQVLQWSAAQQKWVAASGSATELALSQITAPVTLGSVFGTDIPGLSIAVPATSEPLAIEVFVPGFSVTGISSHGSGVQTGLAVIQPSLYDGTNQSFAYFTQIPFPSVSTTLGVGPLTYRLRLPSLASATTYQFQCSYGSTSGVTAATLEAGTGLGTVVVPPAYIRATSP